MAIALMVVAAVARPAAATCNGDCGGDGRVTIDELIRLVSILLEESPLAACLAGDADGNGLISVDEIIGAVGVALAECPAASTCLPGTYTYTFTNLCDQAVFIGQNGPGSTSTPPSFPKPGNWAVAPSCTADNAATVCTASGSTCQIPNGESLGQCTCTSDRDCPGSAPCESGRCSTTTTFCMPVNWSSGVFWPRTGCTRDDRTLTCTTGQCGGRPGVSGGQLDCGAGAGQVGPAPPVVLFEATTSAASVNYDVSLNSGYNVGVSAVPVGGGYVFPLTTQAVPCPAAGCVADLDCPTYLRTAGGCHDPCTQCTSSASSSAAYAALRCDDEITKDASGNTPAKTTECSGTAGGLPTYRDMYCAKNSAGDGHSQASVNQGTPTAFSQADCFPGTTFVIPTFPTGYTAPADMGLCLYQSSTPGVNDYKWTDIELGPQDCSSLTDGTACGGYRTAQSDGGYFPQALGYTCRTVTLPGSFPTTTAHLCLPPTVSGLGQCVGDQQPATVTPSGGTATATATATPTGAATATATATPFELYASAGGVSNAAWLTAGYQAATSSTSVPYQPGSTPYYAVFKAACPSAYTWQYDDAASGFACTVNAAPTPFSGFAVSFCPVSTPSPPPTPTPTPSAAPETPTDTPTGMPTDTPTAAPTDTPTGLPTDTPASTPTDTPTEPAMDTPTATSTTPSSPTPTPGALTWIDNGTPTTNVTVPAAGMSYTGSSLLLNDSGMRFCSTAGLLPIVQVDFSATGLPIIGQQVLSASHLEIANIPGLPDGTSAGTYDVVIQTNPNCGEQTTLRMPAAVTYQQQ